MIAVPFNNEIEKEICLALVESAGYEVIQRINYQPFGGDNERQIWALEIREIVQTISLSHGKLDSVEKWMLGDLLKEPRFPKSGKLISASEFIRDHKEILKAIKK